MSKRVQEILARLSGVAHRGGAFSSDVLIAISEVLPDYPTVSLETGCGKSTIMFSNLSSQHFVFAYDDRDAPESSVMMVQSDPEFRSDTTTWVYGPTQRTLPVYRFPDGLMFDVILIDGPHGYPFPDLEYALLYDRLKPGGILIVDDVHIPSIGAMYDLLREDRMYEDIGVFSTTGLLRRSALEGVPSDGDHWFEQNYNVSRFPLPMDKYHPDRTAQPGRLLAFDSADTIAKYTVKALDAAPGERAARTIDMAATLAFDLGELSGPVTVELTYRSIYPEAAAGATIVSGRQSHPLPFHPEMATERFVFEATAGRALPVTLLHPAALPEHDIGKTRYDFRRLGVVIKSVRLSADDPAGRSVAVPAATRAMPAATASFDATRRSEVPEADEFTQVLDTYAAHYAYGEGVSADSAGQAGRAMKVSQGALYRFLGQKRDWHIGEFLCFEGGDFADAVTWALCERRATARERNRMEVDRGAPNRIAFALEHDHRNRKDGSPLRLHGLKFGRRLWRTANYFERKKMPMLAKATQGLLRRYARGRVHSLMLEASLRQMQLMTLDRLSALQDKVDAS